MDDMEQLREAKEYEERLAEYQSRMEESLKYGDRVLDSGLAFWQECTDFEQKHKWGGSRGHETICHFFANLPAEERDRAVENYWDKNRVTAKQLKSLKWQFSKKGMYFVQEDFTMLEAAMLFEWLKDFDNLDKKPLFDMDYVMPHSEEWKKRQKSRRSRGRADEGITG